MDPWADAMSISPVTDNTAKQRDLSSTSHGMYALAVGRLSLSASGRDQYTEGKDEEAMERKFRHWKDNYDTQRMLTDSHPLYAIWTRVSTAPWMAATTRRSVKAFHVLNLSNLPIYIQEAPDTVEYTVEYTGGFPATTTVATWVRAWHPLSSSCSSDPDFGEGSQGLQDWSLQAWEVHHYDSWKERAGGLKLLDHHLHWFR